MSLVQVWADLGPGVKFIIIFGIVLTLVTAFIEGFFPGALETLGKTLLSYLPNAS